MEVDIQVVLRRPEGPTVILCQPRQQSNTRPRDLMLFMLAHLGVPAMLGAPLSHPKVALGPLRLQPTMPGDHVVPGIEAGSGTYWAYTLTTLLFPGAATALTVCFFPEVKLSRLSPSWDHGASDTTSYLNVRLSWIL